MAYRTPPFITPFAIVSLVLALSATNVVANKVTNTNEGELLLLVQLIVLLLKPVLFLVQMNQVKILRLKRIHLVTLVVLKYLVQILVPQLLIMATQAQIIQVRLTVLVLVVLFRVNLLWHSRQRNPHNKMRKENTDAKLFRHDKPLARLF